MCERHVRSGRRSRAFLRKASSIKSGKVCQPIIFFLFTSVKTTQATHKSASHDSEQPHEAINIAGVFICSMWSNVFIIKHYLMCSGFWAAGAIEWMTVYHF